jgi:type I site-specific restriction-modification system R (restriction) subunit
MSFRFAVLTVVSDGITARYGTPFTPLEHFAPWNVDDDGKLVTFADFAVDENVPIEMETLIDGLFNTERFLQLLRNFTAFDEDGDGLTKRIAKPHQYFAVTKAVGSTVQAAETNGKAGVVWHTQGSGKSMETELYAHLVAQQAKLKNPTIVVVTDRKELDSQLYETFNRSRLLAESPGEPQSSQLARAWSLCAGNQTLADLRQTVKFYEQVRIVMGKLDAQQRQAEGKPVPEDIKRLLSVLVDESTAAGGIVDIYEAAGLEKPSLSELTPDFETKVKRSDNAHLAIEALRALITEEMGAATKSNLVRQRSFSDRVAELMRKYTNQQLTSAEVIAELVAMAKEVAAEGNRGQRFTPPLSHDELAFYDAVADNESAVEFQGEDVLAQIARELVIVMQRDTKTDWTVRDDVRAKLRSSIKRLLVKYKYPPDKQPAAIKLVIDQMEALAPQYAERAQRSADGEKDD